MENKKESSLRKPSVKVNWWKEILFFVPVALFVFVALRNQLDVIPSVFTSIAVATMSVYLAHIIRKIMFIEFSVTKLYNKALEGPLSSSIVFMSLIYFVVEIAKLLNFN